MARAEIKKARRRGDLWGVAEAGGRFNNWLGFRGEESCDLQVLEEERARQRPARGGAGREGGLLLPFETWGQL